MFGLFRKRKEVEVGGYFPLALDIHSHILPGIDDGAPDVETSIHLIKGLMQLGVKRSVATPHVIGDMYRNNPDTIFKALNILRTELQNQHIDFEVEAAAEYMLDAYFIELLENKNLILTLPGNHILTEFSFSTIPSNPEKMSFALITEGFIPILAHPERYSYFFNDYKSFHRLHELGYKLQINLLSLAGYYGKDVSKAARYILKNDLASFIGTDMHHQRHLDALSDSGNRAIFKELLGGKEWNNF